MKGKSTVTILVEFTQCISEALDNCLQVDVILVYTNLSTAFDHVNNFILLLMLIKSLLIGRQQTVGYSGFESKVFSTCSGVADGSNFEPLLFIFYNDMICSINCKTFVYAND